MSRGGGDTQGYGTQAERSIEAELPSGPAYSPARDALVRAGGQGSRLETGATDLRGLWRAGWGDDHRVLPRLRLAGRSDGIRFSGVGWWRRGWDSNPRWPEGHNGFRDRPIQPLWHLSAGDYTNGSSDGSRNDVPQVSG